MKAPSSVTELRRFMGMVNQMSKFSPNIAKISKPLCDLISTKNSWTPQEESLRKTQRGNFFSQSTCTIWCNSSNKDKCRRICPWFGSCPPTTTKQYVPGARKCMLRFKQVKNYVQNWWLQRNQLSSFLYQSRIVIPSDLRNETMQKIHHGHQGIQRCRLLAVSSVQWPEVSGVIEQFIQSCRTCQKLTAPHWKLILPTPLPNFPWEQVATDLFELKNSSYLLVADYYSRFLEVQKLTSTTSSSIIGHLKAIFSMFGIPEILVSDIRPHLKWNFHSQHITTSPY